MAEVQLDRGAAALSGRRARRRRRTARWRSRAGGSFRSGRGARCRRGQGAGLRRGGAGVRRPADQRGRRGSLQRYAGRGDDRDHRAGGAGWGHGVYPADLHHGRGRGLCPRDRGRAGGDGGGSAGGDRRAPRRAVPVAQAPRHPSGAAYPEDDGGGCRDDRRRGGAGADHARARGGRGGADRGACARRA